MFPKQHVKRGEIIKWERKVCCLSQPWAVYPERALTCSSSDFWETLLYRLFHLKGTRSHWKNDRFAGQDKKHWRWNTVSNETRNNSLKSGLASTRGPVWSNSTSQRVMTPASHKTTTTVHQVCFKPGVCNEPSKQESPWAWKMLVIQLIES